MKCSVILSIYKDLPNLDIILYALQHQTIKPDQIIISEDGEDENTNLYIRKISAKHRSMRHLTQEDNGFRKCTALNRAVINAENDFLIFIDGDCIPHKRFIQNHLHLAEKNKVSAGRRLEFGPVFSCFLRKSHLFFHFINSRLFLSVLWPLLFIDKVKNFEVGFQSKWLYEKTKNRPTKLLGCNFACFKEDLLSVNGFNEEYKQYGKGEDSEIEWRLNLKGIKTKNTKFLTPVFHLDHPKKSNPNTINEEIFKKTKNSNNYWVKSGIDKYINT